MIRREQKAHCAENTMLSAAWHKAGACDERERHQKAPYNFLLKGKTTVAQTYKTQAQAGKEISQNNLF